MREEEFLQPEPMRSVSLPAGGIISWLQCAVSSSDRGLY